MKRLNYNKKSKTYKPWYERDLRSSSLEKAADKLLYHPPKKNKKLRNQMKERPVVKLASADIRNTGKRKIKMNEIKSIDEICGPEWHNPLFSKENQSSVY